MPRLDTIVDRDYLDFADAVTERVCDELERRLTEQERQRYLELRRRHLGPASAILAAVRPE